ncbi:MAG: cation transporter [Chloroflexi bacterium]|uniref:cation diffusion facilitator family transporter n=1 Tax=Candidatus Flexifilum breve TaxID=3140694 RepID=UPI0031353570|nr:cation transporter [Chloroflexota bacterium]
MTRASLTRYAWLSIAAALLTIGLKGSAYLLSGSVGLLSDALESGVNLIAAVVALGALTIAARPADDAHNFGHDKAEYFSSGVEGALILVAAFGIASTAIDRLLNPAPLDNVGLGLIVSVIASVVNFAVARVLLRVGKQYKSITLEADSHHLMTDVWTSVAVIVGVGAVALSGWMWLDAVIALLVAANIIRSGIQLLRRSISGLMDSAIPPETLQAITTRLNEFQSRGIKWHALRTRQSGARSFVEAHILVPGGWTVQAGHDLSEEIEQVIRGIANDISVTIHLEPLGDAAGENDGQSTV